LKPPLKQVLLLVLTFVSVAWCLWQPENGNKYMCDSMKQLQVHIKLHQQCIIVNRLSMYMMKRKHNSS